jgi:D-glycero-D-manno-heptose 1,7-bisphosphate phosphatase
MKSKFVEPGGQIDAVYFCPCCPVLDIGEYRRESDCRKTAPGMFLHAGRELDIDMERPILIGDKLSDMAAGLAAGGACFAFGAMDEIPLSTPIRHLSDVLPFISF